MEFAPATEEESRPYGDVAAGSIPNIGPHLELLAIMELNGKDSNSVLLPVCIDSHMLDCHIWCPIHGSESFV